MRCWTPLGRRVMTAAVADIDQTRIHTYIHTYIRTYINKYTHTHIRSGSPRPCGAQPLRPKATSLCKHNAARLAHSSGDARRVDSSRCAASAITLPMISWGTLVCPWLRHGHGAEQKNRTIYCQGLSMFPAPDKNNVTFPLNYEFDCKFTMQTRSDASNK